MKTLSRKEHGRLTHAIWGGLFLVCLLLSCASGGSAFVLTLMICPVPTFLVALIIAAFIPKTPLTQAERAANRARGAAQRRREEGQPRPARGWSMDEEGGAAAPAVQMLDYEDTFGRRDPFERTHNVDGTPMCGGVDINGNSYGMTGSNDPFGH